MNNLTPDIIARAGILPDEVRWHPEHGMLMTPAAVLKLAALCPDTAPVMQVRVMAREAMQDSY